MNHDKKQSHRKPFIVESDLGFSLLLSGISYSIINIFWSMSKLCDQKSRRATASSVAGGGGGVVVVVEELLGAG